jgi:hypothetical protein
VSPGEMRAREAASIFRKFLPKIKFFVDCYFKLVILRLGP